MTTVQELRARVYALCKNKGITSKELPQTILAYLVLFGQEFGGDPAHTLSLMEDDANLTDISIIDNNFRKSINDLISPNLKNDLIFPHLIEVITNITTRSIGVGEYALTFILKDYKFIRGDKEIRGDGSHPKGETEVKKDNSSLKVVESDATKKGFVDDLNTKYFNGTKPGARDEKDFQAHLENVTDAYQQYFGYFSELYPGVDVTQLSKDVANCYTEKEEFINVIGKFALKRYKEVDGWYNIFYINPKKKEVINIVDVDNIDGLGLKFTPKFKRGGSTQAVADGHVDVKF